MAKKKTPMSPEEKAIRDELAKEARRANALLQRLQGFYGDKRTYAGKRLLDKLSSDKVQGLSAKGLVKFNRNMPIAQAKAILKAVKQFNQSKTSTTKGVEETAKKTIKGLGANLDISISDAEKIYQFLGSDEYLSAEIDNITSEIIVAGADTMDEGGSFDFFLRQLEKTIDMQSLQDKQLMLDLEEIYYKYFRR